MAEPGTPGEASTGNDSDQDFDPSAEMMLNDFDIETSIDEEEALDDAENEQEIDDLQKEGEMPLEQLLALYGYGAQPPVAADPKPTEKAAAPKLATASSAVTVTAATTAAESSNSSLDTANTPQTSQMSAESEQSAPTTVASQEAPVIDAGPLWRYGDANMDVDEYESEGDEDYEEEEGDESWRRTIQVGADYQAQVPDGLSRYDRDVPAYENEDTLLWDPTHLHDKEIEDYLRQVQHYKMLDAQAEGADQSDSANVLPDPTLPMGSGQIRDDQQSLYLLHQCGHKTEEALRRRRMQSQKNGMFDTMTSWSEEECRSFEEGLRTFGKDFYLIQRNKVQTRSVGELVQFYYYWKKTERHDVFVSTWRIEKKKFSLHPGTTDYMDRFLDEQENLTSHMSSSLSSSSSLATQSSHSSRLPQVTMFSNHSQSHQSGIDGTLTVNDSRGPSAAATHSSAISAFSSNGLAGKPEQANGSNSTTNSTSNLTSNGPPPFKSILCPPGHPATAAELGPAAAEAHLNSHSSSVLTTSRESCK